MKPYLFIFLFFLCSCENNRKPTGERGAILGKDSIKSGQDSSQSVTEASRSLTYQEQLNYISDTIKLTTKQNYYNRDYALTINEFIEDKEKAIELLQNRKSFIPSRYKAYQIILTLDGKLVFKKIISKHTFKDSLNSAPLEKYYLDKVVYRGVRVNRLFFYTYLRPKEKSTDSLSNAVPDRGIEFEIDYLTHIGQIHYIVHK